MGEKCPFASRANRTSASATCCAASANPCFTKARLLVRGAFVRVRQGECRLDLAYRHRACDVRIPLSGDARLQARLHDQANMEIYRYT
jgi:hypothetical protein